MKITAGSQLLTGVPPSVAAFADNELKKLHVKVVKDTKIVSSSTAADGKTELALSNGEKMMVDLYLPTIGVIPNSDFLPKSLLDDNGFVVVDQYLKVKGAEDIWAAGDINNCQPAQYIYCGKSFPNPLFDFVAHRVPTVFPTNRSPAWFSSIRRLCCTSMIV